MNSTKYWDINGDELKAGDIVEIYFKSRFTIENAEFPYLVVYANQKLVALSLFTGDTWLDLETMAGFSGPDYEGKPNCQRIPFDKIATAWEKDIYISNYNRMKDNNFKILDK